MVYTFRDMRSKNRRDSFVASISASKTYLRCKLTLAPAMEKETMHLRRGIAAGDGGLINYYC
jgi:hypothetical protein